MSGDPVVPTLVVGPDGVATLKPAEKLIQEPEVVTERKKQEALAKQRLHRQVALEMYCAEIKAGDISEWDGDHRTPLLDSKKLREKILDECIELAGYLIEKTGGHQ